MEITFPRYFIPFKRRRDNLIFPEILDLYLFLPLCNYD